MAKEKNMKTLAIIQARMNSTRLPGKVLMKISGKTVLEHVVKRVSQSKLIDEVVVATTINKSDLTIAALCKRLKVHIFRGSENDVLNRYYQTAKKYHADNIARITSDCPLIDPAIIDKVIKKHFDAGNDYTANTILETYPDGEDVEIFKNSALVQAWENARLLSEREHVTPYIKKHKEFFKLGNIKNVINLSKKRWTLDNKEDFEFIKKVYQYLYASDHFFSMEKILKCLEKHPELEFVNSHIKRNEGYTKSLNEDKVVK